MFNNILETVAWDTGKYNTGKYNFNVYININIETFFTRGTKPWPEMQFDVISR